MTRLSQLLAHVDTTRTGIEVAPYFNPALPKARFGKVLTLDVFDTATQRQRAAADPFIDNRRIELIEEVDLVGDASSIGALVAAKGLAGKIGFVVSSHNFEHLPNPIRFLRGCSEVLEPGGVLSMAVPDARACFDIFRMPTRLADWLVAYHSDRTQPAPETVFDAALNMAQHERFGTVGTATALERANPAEFRLEADLRATYATFLATREQPGDYRDAHCTVMFPDTLELMLRDLRHLGLIDLEIIEISPTHVHEFFVHLRKPVTPGVATGAAEHLARRQALAERIVASLGSAVYRRERFIPRPGRIRALAKTVASKIIGPDRYAKFRAANCARRDKRRG